ncbi:amino acid permease-associated region [Streptomyces bingchenggensis BCW-1]|uniref:Amino acid permease-associated region n=1 Tax=Streptomyces bingchenggensis (strain BCW-1) TaxID=749414 RepID=D7CE62_STRBB|nr:MULTISPECIES: APC family permease [Streptomyces]ADI06749.1 amino acid permease-associated region [Streptomyces bingchenggensis BCW-1]
MPEKTASTLPTVSPLARVVGTLAVAAATLAAEYGSGVNLVLVNALGAQPGVTYLVPVALVAAGFLLGPAVWLFARFAQALPRAGSVYVWMTRTVGLRTGFAASALYVVGVVGSIGFQSYGFAVFLGSLLKAVGWTSGADLAQSPGGHIVLGAGLLLVFTLLQLGGIRSFGRVMAVMLAMVLGVVVLTVAVCLAGDPHAFAAHAATLLGHPVHRPADDTPSLSAFLGVLVLFIYSYGGVSAAPSLGGETRDGGTLARGLVRGWAVAIVLYGVVATSVFHAVPWYAVHPLAEAGHQDAASIPGIIAVLAPRAVTVVFDLFVVVVAGKTVAPLMVDCSRVMYAWSQDGLLPAACARTTRRQVPVVPVLVTAVLGLIFLVEEATAGFQIGIALRSVTFMLVIAVVGVGWLGLRLRPAALRPQWAQALVERRELLFAAPAAIVVSVIMIAKGFVQPDTPLLLQPAMQALATLVVAVVLWVTAKRRRAAISLVPEPADTSVAP